MKSFIIKYVLFSIFLSGTVMPVHAYAHAGDCPPAEEQQWTADTETQSDTQDTNCDHCCHFSSHSVGLNKTISGNQALMKGTLPVGFIIHYHLLIAAPPYHPPILV